MLAVIADIGNTHVRFAAWMAEDRLPRLADGVWQAAPALRGIGRLATPSPGANEEEPFRREATAMLASHSAVPLVLVSVVPRVDGLLDGIVPDLRRVGHMSSLPFRHALADVAATGADRLCNVAAAVGAGLRSALVVDAGTATTVDVLIDGVFVGGVIAPGMAFALEQLGRRAARLAPVPFGEVPLVAGADTAAAMSAGAFHAGRGGIEALIDGLQAVHGALPVVLTGGLGGFLDRPGRFRDSQWTLRGAALLAGLC